MRLRQTIQITAAVIVAAVAAVAAGSAGAGDVKTGQIAYTSTFDGEADIFKMLGDGTEKVNLTHDKTTGVRYDTEPAWSPDGTLVAFERHYRKGGAALMVVRSDGSKLHNLLPVSADGTMDHHPNFLPDGSMIVFSSDRDGNFDLYGVKASGKGLIQITNTKAPVQNLDPSASLGGWVVFARTAPSMSGGASIYMTQVGSKDVYPLTQNIRGEGDRNPVFSPNGSAIAFSSDRAGSNDVFVMNRDGKGLEALTTKLSDDNHPTWAPNGKSLAFVSDRSGVTEIYTQSLGNAVVKQLTFDKAFKANPTWLAAVPALVSPPTTTLVSPGKAALIGPPIPHTGG
jgi:TolB protein